MPHRPAAARLDGLDWPGVARDLDDVGHAVLEGLLDSSECSALSACYDRHEMHRKRVVMAQHAFGRGEYRYFAYPLPELVAELRTSLYRHLAPIANGWNDASGVDGGFPAEHASYLEQCHAAGQCLPTPLLLRYGAEDYNCLHQDLYGNLAFPLQAAILLAEPGRDFTGGEFVLTEQRPRRQSRVTVVPLAQGDAVVFAVNQRPVRGSRGSYRVRMRHGVSRVRSGRRHTLGLIFHDAA